MPSPPANNEQKIGFFSSLQGVLILLFLSISIIPLLIAGSFVYQQSKATLYEESAHKLTAIRDIKTKQISAYFQERLADIHVFANNPSVISAISAFDLSLESLKINKNATEAELMQKLQQHYLNKPDLIDAKDQSDYSQVHAQYHPMFRQYQQTYGYYDVFLVEPHTGTIVYSVFKEKDFGTSLQFGEYSQSNIAELFNQIMAGQHEKQATLIDFSFYAPSNAPASFIGSPVFENNKLVGILIFQLSIKQINAIMQERTGLGLSGESYIVGADKLMRSDSLFSDESSILQQAVSTRAVEQALAGKIGISEEKDYRDVLTLSAYKPLPIQELNWAVIVEEDVEEIYAAVTELGKDIILITLLCSLIVAILAWFFSKTMTTPLLKITEIARRLAAGDINQKIDIKSRNEIGQMASAFQGMIVNLRGVIGNINQVSGQLAKGNFNARIEADFVGDFSQIKQAMNQSATNLQSLVKDTSNACEQLANGVLTARIERDFPGDFAQIKQATNSMANNLQEIIDETNSVLEQLAQGDTDVEVQGQFAGNFIGVKQALESTATKLMDSTIENDRQAWLKNGQAQLNERLRGEQSIKILAKNTIDFLVNYLGAQIGLLYMHKSKDTKNNHRTWLEITAVYGYSLDKKKLKQKFYIGEDLVGQAVLEKKAIVRQQTESECSHVVQSGLIQAVPKEVLLIPFLYEDEVKGVIELGSASTFSPMQHDFLIQAMTNIGIAINASESRTRTQMLLEQSQAQSTQLQAQQAEMQHSNEELQSQTEELQSQTEELQSQQEELSQANHMLEERGREMRQQQQAVEEKNTALEQAQDLIKKKAEDLELASKYKSEFLANMSHELRTPLNSLLILAQLLESNKDGNLNEKQIECARTIHGAGADLLNLINEILDLSKVEAGKIEIHPESINLEQITANLKQKFAHVAEEKSVGFAIDLGADLPESIYTDPQRLQQIINNLLSNAFKFTLDGAVTLSLRRPHAEEDLSASGLNAQNSIVFSVKDSGIGISKQKQKVIFEAFQQEDGSTSRRFGGTGLGLSISRQLTQLMGGEIHLHSEQDQGAEFIIFLPENIQIKTSEKAPQHISTAAKAKPQSEEKTEEKPTKPAPTTRPVSKPVLAPKDQVLDDRYQLKAHDKSLLIIEDDQAFAKILMELAREKNFKCISAQDGKEGLELASELLPSAIMLDVGLPQIDGWTVMEKLKENPDTRHIPVHFMSGRDDQQAAQQMGAVGYALKPVSMGDLFDAFKKMERFILKSVKDLLIITDDETHSQNILDVLANDQINAKLINNKKEALLQLQNQQFECAILDVSIEKDSGMDLLVKLSEVDREILIPIIIYTERELNEAEEKQLLACQANLNIKEVHSPERLLDEASLFLHEVNQNLPKEQQQMLHMVHDKEAILKGKKILIVDDDSRNSFALAAMLEEKSIDVIMAPNGKEGLQQLQDHADTALVLMDIMMPEMDGYEAMREIRKQSRYRKLPVIALTAKAMKGDRAKCIEAGASDYLAKPIDMDKLISLLRVWLHQ